MRRLKKTIFDKRKNAGLYWYRIRNPVRISLNALIMSFAKYFPSLSVKRRLLRLVGINIGRNVSLAPCTLDPLFPEFISIGDNVIVGWDVLILTHEIKGNEFRNGRVIIDEDATIGARSTILPGVRIGKGAIVQAGSLVNRDVKNGEIVGDVPIKKISLKQRR